MPYRITKRDCTQSSGRKGGWVLSYTDKKGKHHSNCHTSKAGAESQRGGIEGPWASEGVNETTYSKYSTATRNPYEGPGDEFDMDPDDPVGLVRMSIREILKDKMTGE